MKDIKVIIVAILAIVVVGGGWFLNKDRGQSDELVACTADAKICPDGSAVGRVGPNCEFAGCPSNKNSNASTTDSVVKNGGEENTDSWTKYVDEEWKYSFEYPSGYTIRTERDGFEVFLEPNDGADTKRGFFSVIVIQYPKDLKNGEEIPEYLFYQANLPDGTLAWFKDRRVFDHTMYLLGFENINFGTDKNKAIRVRETSINEELGEYRSVVYVLRDPVIYRVIHDLGAEATHGDIIKRIEDSFKILP